LVENYEEETLNWPLFATKKVYIKVLAWPKKQKQTNKKKQLASKDSHVTVITKLPTAIVPTIGTLM